MQREEQVYLERLGQRIKKLREERGISQRLMASNLDIDERHLRRIEKGTTNPTVSLLIRMAGYLQTDIGSLVNGIDQS